MTCRALLLMLCGAALVAGAPLPFLHLDHKPLRVDEISTATRIAGTSWSEIETDWRTRGVLTASEAAAYRRITPARGIVDVARATLRDAPNHVPLYFALAHGWVELFGESTATLRALSALFGLLAFPALFWLCRELFPSPGPAWAAVALAAVSPSHLVLAQDARPSALWILGIFISSAALLRAVRLGTGRAWVLYAAAMAVMLYTHFLSLLLLLAHAITVRGVGREAPDRSRGAFRPFLGATGGAALLLAPWLAAATRIVVREPPMGWAFRPISRFEALAAWMAHPVRSFADLGLRADEMPLFYVLALSPFLALIAYSLFAFVREAPRQAVRFVVAVLAATVVPFALLGIATGGTFSLVDRYAIPLFLMAQVTVAWLFASRIEGASGRRRHAWTAGFVAVLAAGLVSCATYLGAGQWRTQDLEHYVAAASIIGREQDPLILVREPRVAMTLGQLLKPETRIQLHDPEAPLRLSVEPGVVFFFADPLEASLAHYRAVPVGPELWRVESR